MRRAGWYGGHGTLAGRVYGTAWEVYDGWWMGRGVGARGPHLR